MAFGLSGNEVRAGDGGEPGGVQRGVEHAPERDAQSHHPHQPGRHCGLLCALHLHRPRLFLRHESAPRLGGAPLNHEHIADVSTQG